MASAEYAVEETVHTFVPRYPLVYIALLLYSVHESSPNVICMMMCIAKHQMHLSTVDHLDCYNNLQTHTLPHMTKTDRTVIVIGMYLHMYA